MKNGRSLRVPTLIINFTFHIEADAVAFKSQFPLLTAQKHPQGGLMLKPKAYRCKSAISSTVTPKPDASQTPPH